MRYIGYNADGERVYKLTGQSILGQVNSGSTKAQAIFDDAVLYPNPYVVVTSKGYTKHYYAGTERIATVIGTGGFDDMVTTIDKLSSPHDQDIVKTFYSYYQNYDPFFYQKIVSQPEKTEDISGKTSPDLDYQCTPTELVMVDILNPQDILLKSISVYEQSNGLEKDVYFYHGDHLGSASWITDYIGAPIQYIHYAPYGELIANQQMIGYDERYKFTGKERDAETGYDYFGARYYASVIALWLSVDPLADKYPCISPYAYCAWSPIKNVDPNGEWVQIVVGAVVSAAADVALQVGFDMFNGKSFGQAISNVNMREVAGSAAAGAIGVGVVSKVSQVAKFYNLGKASTATAKNIASVAGDVAGSVVSQEISDGQVTADKVKNDVIGGIVGSTIGNVKMNKIKNTPGYKTAVSQLDHAERVAKGTTRRSRVQAVENAQKVVDNYGASTTQAYSSFTSKGTSEFLNKATKQNDNKQVE